MNVEVNDGESILLVGEQNAAEVVYNHSERMQSLCLELLIVFSSLYCNRLKAVT